MTTWTTRIVRGDWMDDNYFLCTYAPRTLVIEVNESGEIRDAEYGWELTAERWGDGEYITNGVWIFSPDKGELERIKASVQLCGTAAAQA